MKDVSVIVPVYNAEKTVGHTLDLLAAQTLESIEIVIIDDGSDKNTAAVLDRYAEKYENMQVYHLPNAGIYRARLEGIRRAKGKYTAFCDADDEPDARLYERLLHAAVDNDAQISVCAYQRVDGESGKTVSTEMTAFGNTAIDMERAKDLLPVLNTSLWNKMFRTDLLAHAIDFEQPPRVMEDMMLMCVVYAYTERIAFIDEPLYRYIVRSGTAMSRVEQAELNVLEKCMRETRAVCVAKDAENAQACDAMAFVHFGLSAVLRRVQGGESAGKTAAEAREYLDREHPLWKKAGKSLGWNLKNKGMLLKPLVARWFFQLHLMGLFLGMYRFVTEKMKIDIKW